MAEITHGGRYRLELDGLGTVEALIEPRTEDSA
jgi:2-keto-4-pentenoate hydratase